MPDLLELQKLSKRLNRTPDALRRLQHLDSLFSGQQQEEKPPTLTSEDEDSLLKKIYHYGTSGIETTANVLDTPGAAVRDTLSTLLGKTKNPLHGVFNPADRTTGWDLLEQVGLGKNREGFHPLSDPLDALRDVAAFGTEVATDPLTYMTFGGSALTKGGKLAKRAGLLGDLAKVAGPTVGKREGRLTNTVKDLLSPRVGEVAGDTTHAARRASIIDAAKAMGMSADEVKQAVAEPLGGLLGIGGSAAFNGPRAQKIAKGMDTLGNAIFQAKIPGTEVRPISAAARLFSAPLHGAESVAGQHFLPQIHEGQTQALAAARQQTGEAVRLTKQAGPEWLKPTEEVADSMRRAVENVGPVPTELQPLKAHVDKTLQQMPVQAKDWGMKLNEWLDDAAGYFPRQLTETVKRALGKTSGRGGQIASVADPGQLGRHAFLDNIQGGTAKIKELAQDAAALRGSPELTGRLASDPVLAQIDAAAKAGKWSDKIKMQQLVDKKYNGIIPDKYLEKNAAGEMIEKNQREEVMKYLAKANLPALESGIYGNHPLIDFAWRTANHEQALDAGKQMLTAFADPEILKHARATTHTPGQTVKLDQLLNELRFDSDAALQKIAGLQGHATSDAERLATLSDTLIPKDFADDLKRYVESFKGPKAVGDLVKVYDAFSNLFKVGVTSPWPAFHARNFLSGQFQNWLHGQFSLGSFNQARDTAAGKSADVADIPILQRMMTEKGLPHTNKNATDMLRLLDFEHQFTSGGHGIGTEVITHGELPNKQMQGLREGFVGGLGGDAPKPLSSAIGKIKGGAEDATYNLREAKVRGVGDAPESTFAPLAAGEAIGKWTEDVNRLAPAIELLRKGHSPAEAKRLVDRAQISYARRGYTPFENEVVKRIAPFYSFTRGVVPRTIMELAEHPGGRTAQVIRATNRGRNPGELTPDYVSETAAIPGGTLPDGSQRYITGFGLQHEDPLSFLGGGVKGGLLESLSRLNPIAKAPFELASGQTFFQKGPIGGRALEDLDPVLGRTLSNLTGQEKPVKLPGALEYLASNSPAARVFTTARKLTDPRKRNLGGLASMATGISVTDVSPAARDALERERVGRAIKDIGGKSFEKIFIPKSELEAMSPQERAEALRWQAMMNLLADRAKERKAKTASGDEKKRKKTLASLLQ